MIRNLIGVWIDKRDRTPDEMGEYYCRLQVSTTNGHIWKKFVGYFDGDTFVEIMDQFQWLDESKS